MLFSPLKIFRQSLAARISANRFRHQKKRKNLFPINTIESLEDRTLLTSFFSGDVNLPIPDQGTVVSTINVADSFTVADVNVEVNISHGSDQDLDVYLIAPDGTRVELFTDVGGGGDNFVATTLDDEAAGSITGGSAPFTGSFRPEGNLSDFDGMDAGADGGVWSLEITDDKRRNIGTLDSWSIEITPTGPPTLSISDVTVTEGDNSPRFIDEFIPSIAAPLDGPWDVEFGPDGNVYVSGAEASNNVIRYNATTGVLIDEFVTSGSGGLERGGEITFGPDGNLYISSRNTNEILRYDGSTGAFLGAFVTAGSGGLAVPRGLGFGPDGSLYVSSRHTSEVLRYDGATGAFLGIFVTAGSGGIDRPGDIAFHNGALYVANILANNVLRYDASSGAFVDDFVPAGSGGLYGAVALRFGPDGDLYVSSAFNNSVLRYNGSNGAFIEEFASSGSGGLNDPNGLTFGPDGNLFVASHLSHEVLRYGPASQTVFTVSLLSSSSTTVTVDFSTGDGTAASGSDYATSSGTITFAPGETTKTILVSTIDDAVEESTESFFVNLTASTGAAIQDNQGEATILDDDAVGIGITGVSPDSASQNQQLIVTLTGSGFVNGATVDFGNKVNVQGVTFINSSQLDVSIKVHKRASTGSRDVTVTNPDSSSDTLVDGFTITANLLAETTGDGNGIIPLTQAEAESFTELALQLWIGAEGIFDVPNFDVFVADLPGNQLGMFDGNTITFDDDAAGVGWFIDTTPFDNSEFAFGVNGYDLLTAAAHEVGHALGFNHEHDGVMAATLAVGERHLPGEEHHPEGGTLVIPVFDSSNQDDSTSNDSLGTGIITSPQPLAEKSSYALETDFDSPLTDDDFDSSEPVPFLPEEDLDADSFFSEFADSLLDDLLAIS